MIARRRSERLSKAKGTPLKSENDNGEHKPEAMEVDSEPKQIVEEPIENNAEPKEEEDVRKQVDESKEVDGEKKQVDESKEVDGEKKQVDESKEADGEKMKVDESKDVDGEKKQVDESKEADGEKKQVDESKEVDGEKKQVDKSKEVDGEKKQVDESKEVDGKKMKVDEPKEKNGNRKQVHSKKNKVNYERMEVDQEQMKNGTKKNNLHRVIKRKMRRLRSRPKLGMKSRVLTMLLNDNTDIVKEGETMSVGKTLKKVANAKKIQHLKNLAETYQWQITLSGIPKKWKGDIEKITHKYKQFNMQAFTVVRQNVNREICKVLHMFFNSEEEMKNAVLAGQREFLEKPLTMRIHPAKVVYISGIPFDINEETACSDLKEALGSAVYDIGLPKNREGKILGYAIAYVIDETIAYDVDETMQKESRTLALWDKTQCLCSKKEFFKKFTLNIIFGWKDRSTDMLRGLEERLQKKRIVFSVDHSTKKMFFLDEHTVGKTLRKSGLMVGGRQMIFSRSPSVCFVMRNLPKKTRKSDVVDKLYGIHAFNLQFNEMRCKATFEVPVEEIKKCKALHCTKFQGREIQVLQSGCEELKFAKEMSRKRFQNTVTSSNVEYNKGDRRYNLAKYYRKMKNKELQV